MRAREFVIESANEKLTPDERTAIPDMEKFDSLDNSNPYLMWRFLVAAAGEPEFSMAKTSPTNQKFVTIAYSKADADIINATAKSLGLKGTQISTRSSTEGPGTGIGSPVKPFKGYPR
jgi:hypothetical protein